MVKQVSGNLINGFRPGTNECLERLAGQRYCTEQLPESQRLEWLKEVIGKEYANVDITPPNNSELFDDILLYPWRELRLSPIRSNSIGLERLSKEPSDSRHDCFFAVLLT